VPGLVILPKEMFAGERSVSSKILVGLEIVFWCREEWSSIKPKAGSPESSGIVKVFERDMVVRECIWSNKTVL
jgi:hypothetical protein